MDWERVREIEERAQKATEGPWEWWDHVTDRYGGDQVLARRSDDKEDCGGIVGAGDRLVCNFGNATAYYPEQGDEPSEADRAFMTAAREDVPWLVERLREMGELVRELIRVEEEVDPEAYGAAWMRAEKTVPPSPSEEKAGE